MPFPFLCLFCLRSLCSLRSSSRTTSPRGPHKPAFRLVTGRVGIALLGLAVLTLSALGQAGQTINVANGDVAGLIAAIQTLNANGGGSIDLASGGTYSVTEPSDWRFGPNAFPAIASSITINGNQANISRASGSPKFRFFYVSGGFSTLPAGNLTLASLTLNDGLAQGGKGGKSAGAPGAGGAGMGGAIYNQGSVSLAYVTFTSNVAKGGSTGAVCVLVEPTSPSCPGVAGGGGGGMGGDGGGFGGGGGGFRYNGGASGGGFEGGEGGTPYPGGTYSASRTDDGTSLFGGNGGTGFDSGGGGYFLNEIGGSAAAFNTGGAGAYGAGSGGGYPGTYQYGGASGSGSGGGGAFGGGGAPDNGGSGCP